MSNRSPRRSQSALSNITNNSGNNININNGNNAMINPPDMNDSRKRQSKRDEAIRRKIENDLKKKRNSVQQVTSPSKKKFKSTSPGSVLSLKPSEPIICKPNLTVYEASQIMSIKKENCVLVVNDEDELLGIFTAKDLAFRIVGSNLNANTTTVDQIMTPNPMCCKTTTLASDALNLMVSKGFRHLPIVNEANQIVSVLDITKCYNEAMLKLERMYENNKKLQDALEGVNNEIGGSTIGSQSLQIIQYFEDLKSLIEGPTLNDVLDESTVPVYIDIKATANDAAILMKNNRTTAVLVKDSKNNDEVTGIFTSKDVVLRVIAAGLDPKTCSVIRVMTPKPDYASSNLSIHQALRKMFDGRYLNLPVIDDESNEIIGIVEVLKLTYATLDQIKSMQNLNSGSGSAASGVNGNGQGLSSSTNNSARDDEKEGPAWNKFWTSLDNDSESLHSVNSDSHSHSHYTQHLDATTSELAQFTGDIGPSDSVSGTGLPASKLNRTLLPTPESESRHSHTADSIVKEIDFDNPFHFKFKSPVGRVHRISFKPSEGFNKLKEIISSKLNKQELLSFTNEEEIEEEEEEQQQQQPKKQVANGKEGEGEEEAVPVSAYDKVDFAISYIDDEADIVAITNDEDLFQCVSISKHLRREKTDLFIHKHDEAPVTYEFVKKDKKNGIETTTGGLNDNDIFGIPNHLLLPSALVALAASIVVVFTFSRK
ncbi:hypothetical protein PACTADRAFT_51994 [Pachysolen tannophilus NRRL Y-2460]|uniref:CBS domain-containing protein n=1 Tax=Pachysolen tannophilus NRRL Y-2460 TaxID=669874 RepID=A0A1E4TNV1_PACTA|nr:hypothetical protein PACTADRAFT_51994 [Pachysolen tannophilus NRRL Y-2460]